MSSRDEILSRVKQHQPELLPLPEVPSFVTWFDDPAAKFEEVLGLIGGYVGYAAGYEDVEPLIRKLYPEAVRVVSNVPALEPFAERITGLELPHTLENVDVAILQGQFGVAENGAVWIAEEQMTERALPFICQNLVLLLDKKQIVPLMQDAYRLIGDEDYGYGSFIAGPSKTADIEQSLVLGAHGPKGMSVFLMG